MKKVLTLIALAGLLAVQASALTVNLTRATGYFTTPGGEFTVSTVSPDPAFDSIYKNYASIATLNGGFETFCFALHTSIQGNPQTGTLDPSGVAVGTGWLYSQFARGTLASYNYTPGAGRAASALNLQTAIWYLQQQSNIIGYVPSFDPTTNPFILAAIARFGSLANAEVADNGQFGVDGLRLTYQVAGDGTVASQPMLALVPDGGATLILLGLALGGIAAVARRARA